MVRDVEIAQNGGLRTDVVLTRRGLRSLLVGLWVLLPLSTAGRLQVWQGGALALWTEAVAHSPEKPRPWINYGRALADVGADDLSGDAYRTALDLASQPRRARVEGPMRQREVALWNLALAAAAEGRYPEALALSAQIQPRPSGRASLVTRLEQQWRDEQAHGGRSSAF